MKVTADMLAKAATLPDGKLMRLIDKWQKTYGIDPAAFGIDARNAAGIRHALVQADGETLKRLNDLIQQKERSKSWKNSKTCRTNGPT